MSEATGEQNAGSRAAPGSALRWKIMDVAFGDNILKPRRLILEVNMKYFPHNCYTTCSESDGIGSFGAYTLKPLDEWLVWLDRFRDDLTGREIREAKDAALAPFVEPKSWADFRKRYEETGDPWLPNTPNTKVRHGGENL